MQAPDIPSNESLRMQALVRLRILDTDRDQRYDRLTEIAASIAGTPIALISLVDSNRQWFKSSLGLDESETPRRVSFCAHAINQDEPLLVPDVRADARFADNPLVTGDPHIGSYSGFQLVSSEGMPVGTLCVIDTKVHGLSGEQCFQLRSLARVLMDMLEKDAVMYDLANTAERTILFENILKTYLPSNTWSRLQGARGPESFSIEDERIPAYVLFMDAKGFTSYSEKNEPDQVLETLNRYYDSFIATIFHNGGDINKFIGDAILATFDDADAGFRSALEIQQQSREISEKQPIDQKLEFRIGLHAGSAISGTVGNYVRKEQTLIGDVINTASRLQSVCPASGILYSQEFRDALTLRTAPSRRYRLQLKGKGTEIVAYLAGIRRVVPG